MRGKGRKREEKRREGKEWGREREKGIENKEEEEVRKKGGKEK